MIEYRHHLESCREQEKDKKRPYPDDLSITFLILSLGRRGPNIRRFVDSIAIEANVHDVPLVNQGYPALEVQLLDTSPTKEEASRMDSAYFNRSSVPIHYLSFDKREALFNSLSNTNAGLRYFVSQEGMSSFLTPESYRDTRETGYQAQPVSLQRNRASIYSLMTEEQQLRSIGKSIPKRRIWYTDDDTLFLSTQANSPTGKLQIHKNFTPSIFEQVSKMLDQTDTDFSVGSFSGDSPDPLLTLSNNVEIILAVTKNAVVIADPDETITSDSLQRFNQTVYKNLETQWQKNTQLPYHELSIPFNEKWWVGKTWRQAAVQMMGIFQRILSGKTIPLTIMPDNFTRESSKDIIHTNFILSPEVLLLYPYFTPPIGTIRRSEIYWARSTIDTLETLGVKSERGNMLHPSVFHRQSIAGRPFGKQIYWREQLYNKDQSKYAFRGKEVEPTMFNKKIEAILEAVETIPWMNSYSQELRKNYAMFQQSLQEEYTQEVRRGSIELVDFSQRENHAYRYTQAWRDVCKKLFPNLVTLFENKYKVKYEEIPILTNFGLR